MSSAVAFVLAASASEVGIQRRAAKSDSRLTPFSLLTGRGIDTGPGEAKTPKSSVPKLSLAARAGFITAALSDLEAFARFPGNQPFERAVARFAVARLLLGLGHVEKAEEQVRMAVAVKPDCVRSAPNAQAWAHLLTTAGRYGEARNFLLYGYPNPKATDLGWRLAWVNAHPEPEYDAVRLETLSNLFTMHGFAGLKSASPGEALTLNLVRAEDAAASAIGPLVSIVMPAFNAADTIGYSIESLCAQSHINIEILVVDDASTDGTVAVASAIAARDPRVKVLPQKTNGGAFVSRNIGLKNASGEFITVHDADDWSHPQMIEVQLAALMSNSGIVATVSNLVRIGSKLENVRRLMRNTSSLLLSRDTFERIGTWDEVLFAADGELFERIVASFGEAAVMTVEPQVPFTLALASETSLTAASFGGVTYLHHVLGARHIYRDSYRRWHEESRARGVIRLDATDPRPFYAPRMMTSRDRSTAEVDVVIMADLSRPLDRDDLTPSAILAAATDGRRIALIHHPAYPGHVLDPIAQEVMAIVDGDHIRFAVAGDRVHCDILVVAVGQDWGALVDVMPGIDTELALVVEATNNVESTPPSEVVEDLMHGLEAAFGVTLLPEHGSIWNAFDQRRKRRPAPANNSGSDNQTRRTR